MDTSMTDRIFDEIIWALKNLYGDQPWVHGGETLRVYADDVRQGVKAPFFVIYDQEVTQNPLTGTVRSKGEKRVYSFVIEFYPQKGEWATSRRTCRGIGDDLLTHMRYLPIMNAVDEAGNPCPDGSAFRTARNMSYEVTHNLELQDGMSFLRFYVSYHVEMRKEKEEPMINQLHTKFEVNELE